MEQFKLNNVNNKSTFSKNSFTTLDSEFEKDRIERKEEVKNRIMELHQRHVDQGVSNHIIQPAELAGFLDMNPNSLRTLIMRLFPACILNDVLKMMGLPYKK
jgi:hypothetical protein